MSGAYVNAGVETVAAAALLVTPPWPAAMVVGNTLLAFFLSHAGTGALAFGGVVWDSSGAGGSSGSPAIQWRAQTHRIDGTESGSGPDLTTDVAADLMAVIFQVSGLRVTNPMSGGATALYDIQNPHNGAGFNTAGANSFVVAFDGAFGNTVLATPPTWTLRNSQGEGVVGTHTTLFSKLVANSGDPTGDITQNGANADWMLTELELFPPAGAGSAGYYRRGHRHAYVKQPP